MPRKPNMRLRLLLEEADWGPVQCARAIQALATEYGLRMTCTHTAVRGWLDGAQPRPPAPGLLLECLSRRLSRPVEGREAGLTRAPSAVVSSSWDTDPLHKLRQLVRSELDFPHGALLGAGVVPATAFTLPQVFLPAVSPLPEADPPEAKEMQAMAVLFARATEQFGGTGIRTSLAVYLAHSVVPKLHTGRSRQGSRQLVSAAAQLTVLLGGMCADSARSNAAQHCYQIAASLAADAGDHATFAIALRAMATQAHHQGRHGLAVRLLAERAVRSAHHTSPTVQAYAHAQLAVTLAPDDRSSALAEMTRAEELHSKAPAVPGPFTSYSAGALHFQRAQTYNALGDHASAAMALETSLRLRAANEERATTLTRARLAEAYLRLGRLDEALHCWQAFLIASRSLHSAQADARLSAMHQLLRPYARNPQAAALIERARSNAR